MSDALAALEIASIPTGLAALDALTKRARVDVRGAGVLEPGRYLLLFTGDLGEVEEAFAAANERAGEDLVDRVLLAFAHPGLLPALQGARRVPADADCVGVIEGKTVSGTLEAADRACKDAAVGLAGLRVTPGLGGRAWFAVTGPQSEVEAAIEAASRALAGRVHRAERIARPTAELLQHLLSPGTFAVGG